jgi:hypothetical protein
MFNKFGKILMLCIKFLPVAIYLFVFAATNESDSIILKIEIGMLTDYLWDLSSIGIKNAELLADWRINVRN